MTVDIYSVVFTPRAREDISYIWLSVAEHNVRAADKLLDAIESRAISLSQLPLRGALRPEIGEGLRMQIESSYLIFYRVSASEVEILRVVHGVMDLTELFN